MEKYIIFLVWKTECCQDITSPQTDQPSQCNPNRMFYRYRQADSKMYMKSERNQNDQAILKKNKAEENMLISGLTTKLQ